MKQIIIRIISVIFMSSAFVQMGLAQDDVYKVSVGEFVRFVSITNGTPPLTYVWYKDGVVVPGATTPEFVINSATLSDAATYTLEVSNSAGSARSNNASCRVFVSPRRAIDTYEVLGMWRALRNDFASVSLPKCLKFSKSKGGQTT